MPSPAPTSLNADPARAAASSPLAGWVEVFRAGTHTDSKGRKRTFAETDLDQMVSNHALGAAPAVLGHPKDDDPAYAWVAGLRREGGALYAAFEDVHPAFEAGVASGAYRNRSLAVYRDPAAGWRVRHVGWLGAVPPAIDGLSREARAFHAPEAGEELLEFAAPGRDLPWGLQTLVRLMRSLRDHLIEQSSVEVAERVLPQYQLDSAAELAESARRQFDEGDAPAAAPPVRLAFAHDSHEHNHEHNDDKGADDVTTISKEQHDQAVEQARRDAQTEADARFSAQGAELAELRAERQRERIATQIGDWKAKGQVLPAEEHGLAEFMATLETTDEASFEFAAAGGAKAKKTASVWFAEFMAARKAQVPLGKRDNKGDADPADHSDYRAIQREAETFIASEAAAGRHVGIAAAVTHVTRQVGN